MSELSESARNLAIRILERDYLIGQDVVLSDEQLRGMLANMQVPAPALLEIASAALELAGVKVEWEMVYANRVHQYQTNDCVEAGLWLYPDYKPCVHVKLKGEEFADDLEISGAVELAAILLHAARTAREWASEGK